MMYCNVAIRIKVLSVGDTITKFFVFRLVMCFEANSGKVCCIKELGYTSEAHVSKFFGCI